MALSKSLENANRVRAAIDKLRADTGEGLEEGGS
jgi:hypothetical protein